MSKIICVTPVKNEEWIVDNFITSAAKWANEIKLVYQKSTDKTYTLIRSFKRLKKIQIIKNDNSELNEYYRQLLALKIIRQKHTKNIILGIDCDEILSQNAYKGESWKNILKLPEDTNIAIDWYNICPDLKHCWVVKKKIFGYVDNGESTPKNELIHIDRVPLSTKGNIYYEKKFCVIHLQYIDWQRMLSKQRWYQCLEAIKYPTKSLISIYRQYHHMYAIPKNHYQLIPSDISSALDSINLSKKLVTISSQSEYWWDEEVNNFITEYGIKYFEKLSIWPISFNNQGIISCVDPRSLKIKLIHMYLKITQKISENVLIRNIDAIIDKILL